ncbi:uncharacterized protein EAE97_004375 [Botrytis byssoidea]|uniref:Uncharacterized protein n=1 Tax=Botrytis byssoidea TaxID=139641 RepID=A0A9P5ISU6_9HELO|nr:uncharacterized protein EAE97_004375 [Botrytis byssoidea]KAF7947126.1 hypothetical protein EAE97_004375 [Botrytis byssoidea]
MSSPAVMERKSPETMLKQCYVEMTERLSSSARRGAKSRRREVKLLITTTTHHLLNDTNCWLELSLIKTPLYSESSTLSKQRYRISSDIISHGRRTPQTNT